MQIRVFIILMSSISTYIRQAWDKVMCLRLMTSMLKFLLQGHTKKKFDVNLFEITMHLLLLWIGIGVQGNLALLVNASLRIASRSSPSHALHIRLMTCVRWSQCPVTWKIETSQVNLFHDFLAVKMKNQTTKNNDSHLNLVSGISRYFSALDIHILPFIHCILYFSVTSIWSVRHAFLTVHAIYWLHPEEAFRLLHARHLQWWPRILMQFLPSLKK